MDYTQYSQIEFRRKFWKIVGASITMTNPADESVIGFIKMKAWKLREDITLFHDEAQTKPAISIRARQIIDFGATYDVTDSATGQPIASLRRKGLRSTFVRDRWNMMDANGTEFGYIQETSSWLAIARRYLSAISDILGLIFAFIPETYTIVHTHPTGDQVIGSIVHRKNPFIVKMGLTFSDNETSADRRIAVAATALLAIVDATKN